jgi:hypothetical protein
MTKLLNGMRVSHPDYGDGTVVQMLGSVIRVDFFGDHIDVAAGEISILENTLIDVADDLASPLTKQKYFTSIEAINLGVVPPDPDQLVHFTMNSDVLTKEIRGALKASPKAGLSKVVIGHYGTGKTHYLQLARAIALKSGWVVSFVEFDPKAADPAKPHLVYKHIMTSLEFPARDDGSVARGFVGFVKEVRAHWHTKDLRHLPLLSENEWFREGLATLLAHNHDEEDERYVAGCGWLAGDKQLSSIRGLAKDAKVGAKVPTMPASKESAEIYAFHLVVVNEILQKLGYKGLLLILDEAEHVRGYNVRRKERANHFFDYLARCAHVPMDLGDEPAMNEHGYVLPQYWKQGPHFGLYVGLTPSFGIPETREECTFIRSPDDVILTQSPQPKEFQDWTEKLLEMFHQYCPEDAEVFSKPERRKRVAKALASSYSEERDSSTPLRNWIKLGGLACSIPLVHRECTEKALIDYLNTCSGQITSL